MNLLPVFTTAGISALFSAQQAGLSASIAHIALGDAGYAVSDADGKPLAAIQAATTLVSERARIPVAGGDLVGDHQLHVTAIEDGDTEYWVKELAFILADGTVLAIWSDPDTTLAWKAAGIDLDLAFDLSLEAVPAGAVTVQGAGTLNLHLAGQLAEMATITIAHQRRFLTTDTANLDPRWS